MFPGCEVDPSQRENQKSDVFGNEFAWVQPVPIVYVPAKTLSVADD
jgi:hypothetical protein